MRNTRTLGRRSIGATAVCAGADTWRDRSGYRNGERIPAAPCGGRSPAFPRCCFARPVRNPIG